MKKKIIRLSLSRETLGLLSKNAGRAVGGVRTIFAGTCGIDCSEQATCPGLSCDCPTFKLCPI
jgi:hypothetical protein